MYALALLCGPMGVASTKLEFLEGKLAPQCSPETYDDVLKARNGGKAYPHECPKQSRHDSDARCVCKRGYHSTSHAECKLDGNGENHPWEGKYDTCAVPPVIWRDSVCECGDGVRPEALNSGRRFRETTMNKTAANTTAADVADGSDGGAGTPVVEIPREYQADIDHLWWLVLIVIPFTYAATGSYWALLSLSVQYLVAGLPPMCASGVALTLPMALSMGRRNGVIHGVSAVLPAAANCVSFLVLWGECPRAADADFASATWHIEFGLFLSVCVICAEIAATRVQDIVGAVEKQHKEYQAHVIKGHEAFKKQHKEYQADITHDVFTLGHATLEPQMQQAMNVREYQLLTADHPHRGSAVLGGM
eukprot:GEMP01013974.1.p1 GENE.GEMP01013974.1~~GEMP01013974.1.p1  ORF type:complete len:363 (+),score=73.28 GEMP01013974.1:159-1247(+)